MNIKPLLSHFENYLSLDSQEINSLETRLSERNIKRRQYILQQGDVCTHYTFVVEGCFKMYKVDKQGREHNIQFAIENGWISDLGSFYTETSSDLYIEAIEKSTILQISKPDLLYLFTHFPKFDRNFRVLVENAFINLQKRVLHNISSTAEERYLDFLSTHPNLFNRISNVQIASYLGVTPEFLSTIRKRITNP